MVADSHLHWSFNNAHVLLPSLVVNSFGTFLVACFAVIVICLLESFLFEKEWVPNGLRSSCISFALWRTGLYSITTFLRLCYMVVAMTCHLGLICVVVVTLSLAQFVIELRKQSKSPFSLPRNMRDTVHISDSVSQPLLRHEEREYPLKSMQTRPRSKSKPDAIFIHPAESNIARADAVALELGIAGDTELVKGHSYMKEEPPWEIGKGKDLAREILLGTKKKHPSTHQPFAINSDSDSDQFFPSNKSCNITSLY